MFRKFRRLLTCILVVSIFAFVLPLDSYASTDSYIGTTVIDTGMSEIGIEIYEYIPVDCYAYKTTSRSHSGRFYFKSDDTTLANFKLTGTFSYDGTLCNVTGCDPSISNVAEGWKVEKEPSTEQVSPTLAKAVCQFKLYKENSSSLQSSATITISCNQSGTTSAAFNGSE